MGYLIVNLSEMVENVGEDRTKSILSDFSCPYNSDVERFIKQKAIPLIPQQISKSFLVFSPYKGEQVLVGYYTVCYKSLVVYREQLNRKTYNRLSKFSDDNDGKKLHIPAPLIAQLGKNFTNGYDKLISGDELLKLACDKIAMVQKNIGGKIVYLECEEKEKLVSFYKSNGFQYIGKRRLDRDETEVMQGQYLIQLFKYIET